MSETVPTMTLSFGEYTHKEARTDRRLTRVAHDERLSDLLALSTRERQAMRARALRVLPLDLAVDVRDELARAERMAAKSGNERRQVFVASRGTRTPRRASASRFATASTDDDWPPIVGTSLCAWMRPSSRAELALLDASGVEAAERVGASVVAEPPSALSGAL